METALYVVSTPIGNLADASGRAADTLRSVAVCYAEDTRRTGRLLAALGAEAPLRSLHAHNEASRIEEVLTRLRQGRSCALVADAGTPSISDPGRRLVEAVLEAGLRVVSIPGPSAVTAALAVSGLPADHFLFLGFPPRGGGERATWLERAATAGMTVVAFESPRRVGALLRSLEEAGLGDRPCVLCRELTKLHEEVRRATVRALAAEFSEGEARGEVTLVFEGGPPAAEAPADREAAERAARRLAAEGLSTRDVAERLREGHGLARNEAYEMALRAGEEPA